MISPSLCDEQANCKDTRFQSVAKCYWSCQRGVNRADCGGEVVATLLNVTTVIFSFNEEY